MTPRMRIAAAGAGLGSLLALVGGIALVASYWHARALAHAYRSPLDGVPDLSAWLPLTTDGLLFGAFAVIYWRRIADMTVPKLAWVGAGLAGAGTVAANLATAHPSVTGWIVAGWAPLTFTLVDFLVALLIPPLVKAWKAADTPVVTARRDTPPVAVTAASVPSGSPWTRPPDLPAVFSGTGPLWATQPDRPGQLVDDVSPADVPDSLGAPVDDWEMRAAAEGWTVPADPDPRVSAASSSAPVVSTRWTEADERIRVEVQGLIDSGELDSVPSGRWFRSNYNGMGSERSNRIKAQLRPRGEAS